MSEVVLVHGFADNNGKHTTDLLRPFFEAEGYNVREFDYGFIELISVKLHNAERGQKLAATVQSGTIGVGHSNGCAVLREASLVGAPFEQLVFINPALTSDADIGSQVRKIHVWHSKADLAVRFAQVGLRWLIPSWGDMGAVGYKGNDRRFINYNKQSDFPVHSFTHLDMFAFKEKLHFFGPLIAQTVKQS